MLVVKNSPANAGYIRDAGSVPGLGRSPGGRHGNPLQYSCLENPMDRGTCQATVPRVAQSRTWLKPLSAPVHTHTDTHTDTHRHTHTHTQLSTLQSSDHEKKRERKKAGQDMFKALFLKPMNDNSSYKPSLKVSILPYIHQMMYGKTNTIL